MQKRGLLILVLKSFNLEILPDVTEYTENVLDGAVLYNYLFL